MPDPISPEQLAALGFEPITRWVPYKDSIRLASIAWSDASGWIYAFVSEGRIRYVGIATTVLRSRMDGYRHQLNDRVGALIRRNLDLGFDVEVFGIRKPAVAKEQLEIEETRLINHFGADWNVQKVQRDT